MYRHVAFAACVAAVSFALPVRAEDEPWRSQLEVGSFNAFHDPKSTAFDLQLRPGWRWLNFGTFAGVMGTTKGALYAYGGFTFDLKLDDHWIITPDAAVGYYSNGSGKKLGNESEFRTGIALDYQFDNSWRAGVALHHISNAGLGKLNPGVEIGAVTLAIPLFGPPQR